MAGGPGSKTPLKKLRITRSRFIASNKSFKIIDDWSVRANAHGLLEGAWLGTTDFREVAEYIDDDSDEEIDEPDEEEEEKELGETANTAVTPTEEAGRVEHFDMATPEEPDRTCRQLFAAARAARPTSALSSGVSRRHTPEGECKREAAGHSAARPLAAHAPTDHRERETRDAPAASPSSSSEKGPPRGPFSKSSGEISCAW